MNDVEIRERDILFNQGDWRSLIESQRLIFDPAGLAQISAKLEVEFRDGHAEHRKMPEISEHYTMQRDWGLHQKVTGYDLPCLITAAKPSGRRIVLCAQDPWRKGDEAGITVGTFFGIDNKTMRQSRRHYGVCWHLVLALVDSGYDVWLTDAWKLFVKGEGLTDGQRGIMKQVLAAELEAVAPFALVAFGKAAERSLRELSDFAPIGLLHPAARRTKDWAYEGLPESQPRQPSFQAKIDRYLREIRNSLPS